MPGMRDAKGRFVKPGAPASWAQVPMVQIIGMDELLAKLDRIADGAGTGAVATIGTSLTDPPYPFYLEYGTSRMPAYPSARPAFDEKRQAAIDEIANVLGALIENTAASNQGWDSDNLLLAVEAGGQVIRNRWAELARYRTGTYRGSIHVETQLVSAGQTGWDAS